MSHSILGASGAHRWMNCPGSVRLTRDLPDVETTYAREGTAAHALAEVWLRLGSIEGITEIEGVAVTDEMREAVQVYVDYVRLLGVNDGPSSGVAIEHQLNLNPIRDGIPGAPNMFGTADAVVFGHDTLDVADLKYGKGVPVEAVDNVQGLYYVLGAFLSLDYDRRAMMRRFTFTIVQPRAVHPDGPVRRWVFELQTLLDFMVRLQLAVRAAIEPDAPLTPGSWCRFCTAQGHCPALLKKSQALAQVDFADMPLDRPPEPEMLSMTVVTDILSKAAILEDWLGALRARVQRELEAGREVPGWKLVLKRAVRVWNNTEELQRWATGAGLADQDIYEEPSLRSPAQIEKLVGKKNLPSELYSSVSSGLTMVPATDARPAIAAGPQQDFAALPPATIEQGQATVSQSEEA